MLNIARNHIATTSKDVTFLDGFGAVITPQLGKDLAAWLNEGKEPVRLLCADCGGRIKDSVQKSTGELIPAAQCAAMAQKYVGRPLCKACLLKAMKQKKEGSAHDPSQPAQEPAQ